MTRESETSTDQLPEDFLQVEILLERLIDNSKGNGQNSLEVSVEALDELTKLYETSSEAARLRLITATSSLDGIRPLLEKALQEDGSPLIRHEAAFGLGNTGDSSTLQILINVGLRDPHPIVRHEAAMALDSIADPAALPHLYEGSKDPDSIVSVSCELAINRIRYQMMKMQARTID